jgi:hypothetical protein
MKEKQLPEAKMLDMLNSSETSFVVQNEELRTDIPHVVDDPMAGIRVERNRLLGLCDWTQVSDVVLSNDENLLWKNYRQELRDITKKFFSPSDVIWPKNPGIN